MRLWVGKRRWISLLWKAPVTLVRFSRIGGLFVIMTLFVFFHLSPTFRELLYRIHPNLANWLQDAKLYAEYQIRHHSAALATEPNIFHYTQDLLRDLLSVQLNQMARQVFLSALDFSLASFMLTLNTFLLLAAFLKLTTRLALDIAPRVTPLLRFVCTEFLALPLRGRIIIASSLIVNLLMISAWRRNFFSRALRRLYTWHQRVARVLMSVGPYLCVALCLYTPMRATISTEAFRPLFHSTFYVTALTSSLVAYLSMLRVKRQIGPAEPLRSPVHVAKPPKSARPLPPSPSFLSWITPRRSSFAFTPRRDTGERQNMVTGLFLNLTLWSSLTVLHALLIVPQKVLETFQGETLPIFNIWNFGAASVLPPTKRMSLSRSQLLLSCPRLLGIEGSGFSTVLRWLSMALITFEEIALLCLLTSVLTKDETFARWIQKSCTSLLESCITGLTGLHVSTRGKGDGSPGRLRHSVNAMMDLMRVGSSSTQWTTLRAILSHGLPMVLLILPKVVLRFCVILMGLLLPALYSLRALALLSVPQTAYWLAYYLSLTVYLILTDALANVSPLAAWLLFAIRPKFVVVCLLQFVCTEPDTLGVWLAKHATRVSVSAITSARRHVTQSRDTGETPIPRETHQVSRSNSSTNETEMLTQTLKPRSQRVKKSESMR